MSMFYIFLLRYEFYAISHSPSVSLVSRRTESSVWAYYHKPIIVMVIGVLVVGAGGVVSLVQRSVEGDLSPAIVPVCLTIGMMFIVVGLVWLPILRDKQKFFG
uniref:Uncharacterized protein n=1 Tax=Denticeps clupeoides TaxID=299321 RepID=A0A8C4ANN0_9TELE